jgi:hypothetical protein
LFQQVCPPVPDTSQRAVRPTAIRLAEVENAVLDVLETRGRGPGRGAFMGDIETAMDSRGYPGKWVKRALESLVRKGRLRLAGPRYVELTTAEAGTAVQSARAPRRKPASRRRRAALF